MTSRRTKKGCGNDGLRTARKTQNRFSVAAHEPLEIAVRDFHITAAPARERRGKVEIQKQDSHFPATIYPYSNQKTKGNPIPPVTLVLQAHLRIGKGLAIRVAPVAE
jgi:hypothetical protein